MRGHYDTPYARMIADLTDDERYWDAADWVYRNVESKIRDEVRRKAEEGARYDDLRDMADILRKNKADFVSTLTNERPGDIAQDIVDEILTDEKIIKLKGGQTHEEAYNQRCAENAFVLYVDALARNQKPPKSEIDKFLRGIPARKRDYNLLVRENTRSKREYNLLRAHDALEASKGMDVKSSKILKKVLGKKISPEELSQKKLTDTVREFLDKDAKDKEKLAEIGLMKVFTDQVRTKDGRKLSANELFSGKHELDLPGGNIQGLKKRLKANGVPESEIDEIVEKEGNKLVLTPYGKDRVKAAAVTIGTRARGLKGMIPIRTKDGTPVTHGDIKNWLDNKWKPREISASFGIPVKMVEDIKRSSAKKKEILVKPEDYSGPSEIYEPGSSRISRKLIDIDAKTARMLAEKEKFDIISSHGVSDPETLKKAFKEIDERYEKIITSPKRLKKVGVKARKISLSPDDPLEGMPLLKRQLELVEKGAKPDEKTVKQSEYDVNAMRNKATLKKGQEIEYKIGDKLVLSNKKSGKIRGITYVKTDKPLEELERKDQVYIGKSTVAVVVKGGKEPTIQILYKQKKKPYTAKMAKKGLVQMDIEKRYAHIDTPDNERALGLFDKVDIRRGNAQRTGLLHDVEDGRVNKETALKFIQGKTRMHPEMREELLAKVQAITPPVKEAKKPETPIAALALAGRKGKLTDEDIAKITEAAPLSSEQRRLLEQEEWEYDRDSSTWLQVKKATKADEKKLISEIVDKTGAPKKEVKLITPVSIGQGTQFTARQRRETGFAPDAEALATQGGPIQEEYVTMRTGVQIGKKKYVYLTDKEIKKQTGVIRDGTAINIRKFSENPLVKLKYESSLVDQTYEDLKDAKNEMILAELEGRDRGQAMMEALAKLGPAQKRVLANKELKFLEEGR